MNIFKKLLNTKNYQMKMFNNIMSLLIQKSYKNTNKINTNKK